MGKMCPVGSEKSGHPKAPNPQKQPARSHHASWLTAEAPTWEFPKIGDPKIVP